MLSGGSFWELLVWPNHFEKKAHCWRDLCPQSQIISGFWFQILCFGVSCVLDRWGDWTGPRLQQSWDHQISSSSGTLCPLWPVCPAKGVRCASKQCTLHNICVPCFPKSSCPLRWLYYCEQMEISASCHQNVFTPHFSCIIFVWLPNISLKLFVRTRVKMV